MMHILILIHILMGQLALDNLFGHSTTNLFARAPHGYEKAHFLPEDIINYPPLTLIH
jgi:hypothetical protein